MFSFQEQRNPTVPEIKSAEKVDPPKKGKVSIFSTSIAARPAVKASNQALEFPERDIEFLIDANTESGPALMTYFEPNSSKTVI